MCGIFGIIAGQNKPFDGKDLLKSLNQLFLLSESRGKEASGFAAIGENVIHVHKTPFPASKMIKSANYKNSINEVLNEDQQVFACIGHSRLVTNGYEHFNYNNQPVVKKGMVGIHNGIVTNIDQLWEGFKQEKRETDLDTEILPMLIQESVSQTSSFSSAVKKMYDSIYGMTNIAFLFQKMDNLLLATNNGSLYYLYDQSKEVFIFASEYYILQQLLGKFDFLSFFKEDNIKQLKAKSSMMLDFRQFDLDLKALNDSNADEYRNLRLVEEKQIEEHVLENRNENFINTSLDHIGFSPEEPLIKFYEGRKQLIQNLKRCTKCVLPSTFPYIQFDEKGVCNYCNNYQKITYQGSERLSVDIEKFKTTGNRPDCLMPFSGGRDSSFALHYMVKEMGMKPLAYSYDWGMITDLARRNQARMCDRLGIEHILISADIRKKRANISKNVSAWLKRPSLGTIPLFMAGDKQYFYFANLLMKQNDLDLSILGENLLETTMFKSGFCGIKPKFNQGHTYSLSIGDKMKMLGFYGKEYLLNPAYINSSILDTLDSFKSYYMIKHQNINIFDYVPWDESEIESLLLDEYQWETDPGTKTTWRIGDGTAAFYNYIYYMVAGFTENDTFRSNQVREGDISREEALKMSIQENAPRWDSIYWYCNTIKIDFAKAIETINKIKPLFSHE